MHISSQLATAPPNQASRSATSSPANAPGFHQALQAAATDGKTAGGTTAASPSGKAGTPEGAGTTAAKSAAGETVANPPLAGHLAARKSKVTPPAEGPAGPAAATTAATLGTDLSNVPVASTDPNSPAPINPDLAGVDAAATTPAEGQAQAAADSGIPGVSLPAPAAELGMASRLAAGALREAPAARAATAPTDEPGSASDAKPAAGLATASSRASITSATNGTGETSLPPTALNSTQTDALQKDALPLTPANAAGKDRATPAEVRGKRKDTAADGLVPERDSTTAPTPFTAKLAEAQAPAQAGANDSSSPGSAALQQALGGSQPILASMPAPAQTNLPSPVETSAPAPTPTVPSTSSIDVSADPAVMPGASSAQLIQSAGQTEMRLGMRSAEFGNISISTSVTHQTISAQISLDHSELGRALAVHLPAIEEKLGTAYGLHARVEVRDENAASRSPSDTGQQGGGSQEQTGGARGGQGRSGFASSRVSDGMAGKAGSTNLAASALSLSGPAERSRLDIRV